jgi:preprotein translocase subunit SecE
LLSGVSSEWLRLIRRANMSSNDAISSRSLWSELLMSEIYKRNQGRMVRQVTCLAIWVVSFLAAWRFYETFLAEATFAEGANPWVGTAVKLGVPAAMFLAGVWFGYRLVNWPKFADFLISVEAELNKVSWPTWPELYRASIVVMFTIFFLVVLLFSYDLLWAWIFQSLKIA